MNGKQSSKKPFRVIIAGGGIAGLSLAHCLRKYNIDYVLLEARGEIAPQVGASIGINPNGSAIMDQLGMFEDVVAEVEPLRTCIYWTGKGQMITRNDAPVTVHERHGYPVAFLDRQKVLDIMHRHLAADRSKVFLNKRVARVVHRASGVTVECTDGSEWTGDLVVGADGVHSKVRHEMWNHMDSLRMGELVAREKAEMISDYSCVFGISTATPGLTPGDLHRTLMKDRSLLVIIGKNGRVFWFFFSKMDRRYTMETLPRFTTDDLEKHVVNYLDASVAANVPFAAIYNNAVSKAYVPLEEAFYQTWTFDRFACIGDSIHKMTPNMGQGGNSAIESAASLANNIRTFLNTYPDSSNDLDALRGSLSQWAVKRKPRTEGVVAQANDLTRLEALATLKHKLLGLYLIQLPFLTNYLVDMASSGIIGAEVLEFLPTPRISQECLMPADIRYRGIQDEKFVKRVLLAIPLGICLLGACVAMDAVPVIPLATPVLAQGVFEASNGEVVSLFKTFSGWDPLDRIIFTLVTCFLPSISGSQPISRLQMLSFLTDLGPIYGAWLFESYRNTHSYMGILWPLLMGTVFQLKGIGKVAPFYFLINFLFSPLKGLLVANRASVRIPAAQTLLPALIAGYYLPTWGNFFAPTLPDKQWVNATWQIFPVLVPLIQIPLMAVGNLFTDEKSTSVARRPDLGYLRLTSGIVALFSAVAFVYVRLSVPDTSSMLEVFLPPIDYSSPVDSFADAISRFLQYDEFFSMAAALIWVVLSFRDLKLYGFSISYVKTTLLFTMSSPTKNKHEDLLGLTTNEAKLIILGVLCTDKTGKVDNEKIAQKGNYKNSSSASTSYRNAKRRLLELHPSSEENAPATPQKSTAKTTNTPVSTPSKPKGKTKKNTTVESPATGGDEATPSNAKRQKKAPAKSTPTKVLKIGDTTSDEETIKQERTTEEPEPLFSLVPSVEISYGNSSNDVDLAEDMDMDAEFDDMEKKCKVAVKPKHEPAT
ncbi:hypothetical protein FE257_008358 [Aspergillus nanangensis]|uniref:FAD-binding domain-containing protein n=1 Tax=Aspergillus nanangensis TaxID=2582783 RepID=A0AAD4CNG0_ASPNN|nr:hypothetical protein FE257_008358 [Aspergillus nanangensis]